MKVTFPHMGHLYIPVRAFLEAMGLEVIPPPPITKKTLDLGVKHGPECACLPLKINLGNFFEAIESGAEAVIMGGGCGPCRFGYFGEVQREILKDLGHDIKFITIEPNLWHFIRQFRFLCGGRMPWKKLINSLRFAWQKLLSLDEILEKLREVRPVATDFQKTGDLYKKAQTGLDVAASVEEVEKVKKEIIRELEALRDPAKKPAVEIGIVGEIYTIIEPSSNLNTEERLGKLGARVINPLTISHWVKRHLLRTETGAEIERMARPYLNHTVGGHGLESVGNCVIFSRKGVDGIIHIAPFTCMPEIVAEAILPEVSRREGIPIMSLFFDEHTGEAGLQTRLEAFVDLAKRKGKGRRSSDDMERKVD